MKGKKNPYATTKGGVIKAPVKQNDEPKATVKTGDDLRIRKGK